VQATAMSDEWVTYEEAARRLHVTVRAARARAFRGRWAKMQGNDGRARVRLPDEPASPPRIATVRPTSPPDTALTDALKAHIETLKADLAVSEARAAVTEAQLAEANLRADAAISGLNRLADEISKMAEERSRPWWRRLVG